jgi:GNAT superfamily N-acetyltransferase
MPAWPSPMRRPARPGDQQAKTPTAHGGDVTDPPGRANLRVHWGVGLVVKATMRGFSEATIVGWRDALGESCRLWAGPRGRHFAEPGLAITFSGERAIDFNVAICHAPGVDPVERALADVVATKSPGLIMLAGPALEQSDVLSAAGWIQVTTVPLMTKSLSEASADTSVRELDLAGLGLLRSLVEEAFDCPPSISLVALPDAAATDAPDANRSFASWGLYEVGEMVSGVATSTVSGNTCIWSMATPPRQQRRGHGRRLLSGVLAQCAAQGATTSLLLATGSGGALYQSMGFEIVEHWQVWSRSRWVLT